jgi:hypothetical protein
MLKPTKRGSMCPEVAVESWKVAESAAEAAVAQRARRTVERGLRIFWKASGGRRREGQRAWRA